MHSLHVSSSLENPALSDDYTKIFNLATHKEHFSKRSRTHASTNLIKRSSTGSISSPTLSVTAVTSSVQAIRYSLEDCGVFPHPLRHSASLHKCRRQGCSRCCQRPGFGSKKASSEGLEGAISRKGTSVEVTFNQAVTPLVGCIFNPKEKSMLPICVSRDNCSSACACLFNERRKKKALSQPFHHVESSFPAGKTGSSTKLKRIEPQFFSGVRASQRRPRTAPKRRSRVYVRTRSHPT